MLTPKETYALVHRSMARNLGICLGYLHNGTSMSVTISTDDATFNTVVSIGDENFYGPCIAVVLFEAATHFQQDEVEVAINPSAPKEFV